MRRFACVIVAAVLKSPQAETLNPVGATKIAVQGADNLCKQLIMDDLLWCGRWDLNPHAPFGASDFKSDASADFATPAGDGSI